MCRSGMTSRCVSACGLMSRIATKPVGGRDVVALAVERAEEAVVVHAASTPSSDTDAPRTRTSSPTGVARVDQPRRIVVAVARGRGGRRARRRRGRPSSCQRARHASCDAARRRAPRSFFSAGGTGSSSAVTVPGRGEYGKTCTFVSPAARIVSSVVANAPLVLGGEADDHVARQVELLLQRRQPPQVRGDRVAPAHRTQHAVVARLQRDVQMAAHRRRLAQRRDQRVVDVVDLDRREAQALEPGRRACRAHELAAGRSPQRGRGSSRD